MSTAPANNIPPGVTVFCDPTLAPAMRALNVVASALTGAPVSVLSAPASLMVAQIQRHTRNDVLFTLGTAMDLAVQLQLVKPGTRVNGFANSLVLASLNDGSAAPAGKAALVRRLAGARLVVTDNTPASGLNGYAVLAANGLSAPAIMGAANTGDAAFMVTTGAADIGLVYLTDVHANPQLRVLAPLTADPALTAYAAAVNAKAVSPNAAALLGLLASAPGRAVLRNAGLEVPS